MRKAGRWDPIAERLSRWARIELLNVLFESGIKAKKIAKACGVSEAAVSHWRKKPGYHPNNENAARILELAWASNPRRTEDILKVEGERFIGDLKRAKIKLTGVLSPKPSAPKDIG